MQRLFSWVKKQKNKQKNKVNYAKLTKGKKFVPSNITWSLDRTTDGLSTSPFINIPNEIILQIFQFLSIPDLANVSLVCRSFKIFADHDGIWKPKCQTSIKLHSKSYKQIYIEWMHDKILLNEKLNLLDNHYMHTKTATVVSPRSFQFQSSIHDQHASRYTGELDSTRSTGEYQFEPIGGFIQHPNSTQDITINLSVNIDKIAPELISLLEKASSFRQQSAVLKQMIKRYYRFMQLKASQPPNLLLIPTLDIETIWQTHLLRPEMYHNDCLRLFHHVIDHSLIINNIQEFFKTQAFLDTSELYEKQFDEKYCILPSVDNKNRTASKLLLKDYHSLYDSKITYSYWDETRFEFSSKPPKDYENPFSFTEDGIIRDGKWFDSYQQFMSDAVDRVPVSGEIDLGYEALERSKKSYERFLYMAAKYPIKDGNGFISSTPAIDIIWHSHMQEPLNYAADCLRLVGYVINHDPSPIIEDESMKKSCNQIWKDEFQCDLKLDHLYNTSNNK